MSEATIPLWLHWPQIRKSNPYDAREQYQAHCDECGWVTGRHLLQGEAAAAALEHRQEQRWSLSQPASHPEETQP